MHTAIVNCIVCVAVKSSRISAKKEYKLMIRKSGEVKCRWSVNDIPSTGNKLQEEKKILLGGGARSVGSNVENRENHLSRINTR